MMNFCKKMFFFYSFLGFSHSSSSNDLDRITITGKIFSPENCRSGLSLVVVAGDRRSSNVLESVSVVKPHEKEEKIKVISTFGLCTDGGLSSCTESLGFESSDQMEEEEEDEEKEELRSKSVVVRKSWRRRLLLERVKHRDELMKNQIKKFPPPLSSLNQNGKPNFFLKPVRKDGRLEITQVRINQPNEILRVSRQDGRLRLHLIAPEIIQEEEEEEEEEEEVINKESEIQELKFLPLTSVVGDGGFRRCHHHHHLPIWKQHEVTTRSTVHVL